MPFSSLSSAKFEILKNPSKRWQYPVLKYLLSAASRSAKRSWSPVFSHGTFLFAGWTVSSGFNKSIAPCTFFVSVKSLCSIPRLDTGKENTEQSHSRRCKFISSGDVLLTLRKVSEEEGGNGFNKSILTLSISCLLLKVGCVHHSSLTVSLASTFNKYIQVSLFSEWWEGAYLPCFYLAYLHSSHLLLSHDCHQDCRCVAAEESICKIVEAHQEIGTILLLVVESTYLPKLSRKYILFFIVFPSVRYEVF